MGESKRKKLLTDPYADSRKELIGTFERLGIDYSEPGFYDDPNFLKEECRNPRMLESYAQWVIARQRTSKYDDHVREVVPKLAAIMSARLDRHQWFGGCVAVVCPLKSGPL